MKNNMNFSNLQPKDEVVNLKGNTHENGGVPLSNTQEAEANESMIGNFMFSNRLMTTNKNTFSDEAKRIEKKYKKDSSNIAIKSKKKELERLAQSQEQLKQEMLPKEDTETQEMMYGGKTKKKYGAGGLMAAQAGMGIAGGLINMGRGIFGKAREYDDLSFEKASWEDASFDKVEFDNVDYSDQRAQAGVNSRRNNQMGNATIRNNAGSSGQLLGNTLMNNARNTSQLNASNRESFMTEANTNTNIQNQAEQINVGTGNQFSQYNNQGQNQTNQFNTQIGNKEMMTNFGILQQNNNAKDAQQQMIFDGLGQVLQSGANGMQDYSDYGRDNEMMQTMYPEGYASLLETRRNNKRGGYKFTN